VTGSAAGADALTYVEGRALPGGPGGLGGSIPVAGGVAGHGLELWGGLYCAAAACESGLGRYRSTYRLLAFLSTARYNAEGFRLTGG
jgi:hypothetical protein